MVKASLIAFTLTGLLIIGIALMHQGLISSVFKPFAELCADVMGFAAPSPDFVNSMIMMSAGGLMTVGVVILIALAVFMFKFVFHNNHIVRGLRQSS